MTVTIAIEGITDLPVVRKIFDVMGIELGPQYGFIGKDKLREKLAGYNAAARYARWLVLRDLDGDAACAPGLLADLLPRPAKHMCFRVAVRAVEAWLIADKERIASFLGVKLQQVPSRPETLPDPKGALVALARKARHRAIREDMAPTPGTSARVGPAYTSRIIEFAGDRWRPRVAARNSDSLSRCLKALNRWST